MELSGSNAGLCSVFFLMQMGFVGWEWEVWKERIRSGGTMRDAGRRPRGDSDLLKNVAIKPRSIRQIK
jgi:hypothetical protein